MKDAGTFHRENWHCVTPMTSTENHKAQGEEFLRLLHWGVERPAGCFQRHCSDGSPH